MKKKPKINKIAYMVLVEGRGEPKYVHTSLVSAIEEAMRLVSIEPNRLVRVLHIVSQFRGEIKCVDVPLDFPRIEDDPDYIPF